MKRRVSLAVIVALAMATWSLESCRDVPAPDGGILSISGLLLPSPGLVAGDTMRDSTGAVAPLRVIAFNVGGDTVTDAMPSFIVLDTGAHLAGALLVGDSVGRTVRIVATVAALQTLPVSVKVTLSPDTLLAADSVRHVRTYTALTADSVVNSAPLAVRVAHVEGTTLGDVDAVIVRYAVVQSPPSDDGGPTIVLLNGSNLASRDTTDVGKAAIVARLRLNSFVITGADSAIVEATASYGGRTIGTLQFTVVYTPQ